MDEAKNLANICKHQIDFADVSIISKRPMFIEIDSHTDYGEDCLIETGSLLNGVAVVA